MERARAVALTEEVLTRLVESQDEWPLSLLSEVYVYGWFARGACNPRTLISTWSSTNPTSVGFHSDRFAEQRA
ncbi:hypothetical protein [Actinoplanes sp. NPDC026623]|uniref:hypothetical protein n=1 Tax=Actinoplanes sp. NPDC026623 TaxID=3155610 RepID=UPI00340625FE